MENGQWDPICKLPDQLVRPIRVGRDGGPDGLTWRVASGPRYERVASGFYVPADRERSVEQRIVEAAAGLPADGSRGVVTGWAGLRVRGASYFDGLAPDGSERPVELAVQGHRNRRDREGVVAHRRWLYPTEVETVSDLPVASVARCLFDEIHTLDELWAAVTAIDMAAAAQLISVWLFATYVGECNSRNGAPLAREACALAVDESRSPREVWLRLVCELICDLLGLLVNRPVFTLGGEFIGVPDLFDPVAGAAYEYAGLIHNGRLARLKDVRREGRFRDSRLEYVDVVSGQSRSEAAERVLATRRRALFLPASERPWTLTPPAWWHEPETLDAYFDRTGQSAFLSRL